MDSIIVAVEALALPSVVPQTMSGGKVGYDFNLVHRRISAEVIESS
jgi:hypothetical protein